MAQYFDIEELKTQFKEVIEYSQDIHTDENSINDLFQRWYTNKKEFIDAMGGSLTLTIPCPITFELSNDRKAQKFTNFIHSVTVMLGPDCELLSFLDFNKEGFFQNEVVYSFEMENGTVIPAGMKLLKAFKYFIEDKDTLYSLQNMASMIIQENKITGYLCVSVHPLDFLSSSENNYKWRSCHALDGEYRAGNLSYMVDPTTVICYLKGEEDQQLASFPPGLLWNSKKWRMLLFFSKNRQLFFAGRQYPFSSENALEEIKEHIIPALTIYNSSDISEWTNNTVTEWSNNGQDIPIISNTYIVVQSNIFNKYEIIKDNSRLHYNDLLESSCYIPYYCYVNDPYMFYLPQEKFQLPVGGEVLCLKCGKSHIYDSEWMVCEDCKDYDYYYCDCCGTRVHPSEVCYVPWGLICQACAESECSYCEKCGELDYTENMRLYNDDYYCEYCYNKIMEANEIENETKK